MLAYWKGFVTIKVTMIGTNVISARWTNESQLIPNIHSYNDKWHNKLAEAWKNMKTKS